MLQHMPFPACMTLSRFGVAGELEACSVVAALTTPLRKNYRQVYCTRGLSSRAVPLPTTDTELETWPAAELPLSQASTIPSSWYTSASVLSRELASVFRSSWQVLGHAGRLAQAGDYVTGELPGAPYLVCRGLDNSLRAFHNVCRHHAAVVAAGSGSATCFRCPYHGWTYGLDGRLQKAVALRGMEGFKASENGLVSLPSAALGPWVFGRMAGGSSSSAGLAELGWWLGEQGARAFQGSGACRQGMAHVGTREYAVGCNWKVFVDNYLDGGYHVSVAHPDLAAGLELDSYSSRIYERLSIQTCPPKGGDQRLEGGTEAAYVFIYPNFMVNSYGPWVDTNQVIPTGPDTCKVVFEYYLDPARAHDDSFIASSLAASDQVQQEDIRLCESVQRGLASPAYGVGRYVPRFERPMFHFHQLLYKDLHNQDLEVQENG